MASSEYRHSRAFACGAELGSSGWGPKVPSTPYPFVLYRVTTMRALCRLLRKVMSFPLERGLVCAMGVQSVHLIFWELVTRANRAELYAALSYNVRLSVYNLADNC